MTKAPKSNLKENGKSRRVLKMADKLAVLRIKRSTRVNKQRIAKLEEKLRAEFLEPPAEN
jgi:hypothetical protein